VQAFACRDQGIRSVQRHVLDCADEPRQIRNTSQHHSCGRERHVTPQIWPSLARSRHNCHMSAVDGANEELRRLYEADQADRIKSDGELPAERDWRAIRERDQERRQRISELIQANALQIGADYFHAALVFQHGESLEDYQHAHELATRAAELGDRRGRWLAAAALDRWLTQQGKPQKYGTQYQLTGDHYTLLEVDPATTDAERAEWDVPNLADAQQLAVQLTPGRVPNFLQDPPLVALEVPGLRVEIKRWLGPPPPSNRPSPEPQSLSPTDRMRPMWLPTELAPCALNDAYCAIDRNGRTVLTWRASPLQEPNLFVMGWHDANGPVPTLESAEHVNGKPAIWIGAGALSPESLVVSSNPNTCWIISGELSRTEILRVAHGLPAAG
jgi:hypothetical protein